MNKRFGLANPLLAIFLILTLSGCGSSVDVEEAKAKLLDADRAFAQASINYGYAEAFKRYLAEDAIQFPEGGEPVYGRDTIYERMRSSTGVILTWEQLAIVSESGDLGYTWGNYKVTATNDDGEQNFSYGKYVNVWREENGDWKVIADIGNSSPAP